ncbi:MAG TPA: response regulator [Methylomirabilota bacterium]|nr:response regulator [Methylomirabilota bacterium]
MKILVVDDEPEVAEVIAESVRIQGHETVIAHDGQGALDILGTFSPDAVFLDLVMPGLTGLDVLQQIRQRYQELPVIIISGRATAAQVAEAKRLGVTDVVEKPFALKHLSEALSDLDQQ